MSADELKTTRFATLTLFNLPSTCKGALGSIFKPMQAIEALDVCASLLERLFDQNRAGCVGSVSVQ
jgi:hypothetical protein